MHKIYEIRSADNYHRYSETDKLQKLFEKEFPGEDLNHKHEETTASEREIKS